MLAKETIKSCLAGEPVRVTPAYRFWFDERFVQRNPQAVEEMAVRYSDDFVQATIGEWGEKWMMRGQIPKRAREPELLPGEFTDDWGCLFCAAPTGVGEHPTRPRVTTLEQWERYEAEDLPLVEPRTFASGLRRIASQHREHYVLGQFWRTFYERMFMLIGFENLMCEIAAQSELFLRMKKALLDFTLKGIQEIAAAGADAVFLADDWGTQTTLHISPQAWRAHFKPAYAAMIEAAHGLGLDVWFHSCGNVFDLIPEWIDLKLDVLAHLQNGALDIGEVARRYRGRMTFFGGIDVQFNLIQGDRDSIREEVRGLVEGFGADRGKYILAPSNTIMPETPVENVWALFRAFEEFGNRN